MDLEQDVAKYFPLKQNSGNDSSLDSQRETSPFICSTFKGVMAEGKKQLKIINVQYVCLKGKTEIYYIFKL